MFKEKIYGPSSLLQALHDGIGSKAKSTDLYLVGFDVQQDEIRYVVAADFLTEIIQFANAVPEKELEVVVIRGNDYDYSSQLGEDIDVTPNDFANYLKEQFNANVLDVMAVDFDAHTFTSDMCDNILCCNVGNPNKYYVSDKERLQEEAEALA